MREQQFYKKKNVLIAGGAGFIGSTLAKRLVEYGAQLTIVDNFSKACGANSFNLKPILKKIIFRCMAIKNFVSQNSMADFDVIFNCTGLTDHHIGFCNVALDYRMNCYAGLVLLDALRKSAKNKSTRLISIGSRSQYGRSGHKRINEFSPLVPLDIQAAHKSTLDYYHSIYASRYGLDVLYIRLTNVYGPRQRLTGDGIGLVGELIKSALMGAEMVIYGSLDRIKDLVFVEDAVDALVLLGMVSKPHDEVAYNLGGCPCKLSQVVDAIKHAVEGTKIIVKPFPAGIKSIDTGDIVLDTRRIQHFIPWNCKTPIKKGIGITLDYYKRHRKYYLRGQ